jgi:hypothetical protein
MKRLKISKFHPRGATGQFLKKFTSLITYLPFNGFLFATYRSIQLSKWKNVETKNVPTFIQGESPGIFIKNTRNNNFGTVQPIAPNNTPIDLGQQVRFNLILGEQSGIFCIKFPDNYIGHALPGTFHTVLITRSRNNVFNCLQLL